MKRYRTCLPTMSLGHGPTGYSMPVKLAAIAEIGFEGVEIFYGCLEALALELTGKKTRNSLITAAEEIAKLCKQHKLEVINLQPILNYEGIRDKSEHLARLDEISFRMDLARILGTDLLQMAANFLPESERSHDQDAIVKDLQELADLGLQRTPPIRFAYESMCWSVPVVSWQVSWEMVEAVNRPNFGLVLDAFHIAGYEYADPSIPGSTRPDGKERLERSISDLKRVSPDKIFFVQLCDAEKLDKPIVEGQSPYYNSEQPSRMSWSRNCRLFPYEDDRGAFMPIEDIMKGIFATGFEGFVSYELFTRFMSEYDQSLPRSHAERAKASWEKMNKRLSLEQ